MLDWKAWINVFISEATYNPYWSNSTLLYLFDLCRPRSKQGTKSTVRCTKATNHLLFYFTGVTPLYFSILVLSLVKSCMLVRLVLNCLISWLYIVNCFLFCFWTSFMSMWHKWIHVLLLLLKTFNRFCL